MSKGSNHSARVTLRQLCNLGLPAPILLPSLLPALRAVVPSSHAAFFYCDAAGHMTNIYAERMLPPEAMTVYYERYYRDDTVAFSKAYLARVAAHEPVSRKSVTVTERETGYYRDVLSAIDAEHVLYGVVRSPLNGHEPLGQLSMYRGRDELPFTTQDVQALKDVLHYLGPALVHHIQEPLKTPSEEIAEEAMAVLSDDGDVLFSDGGWLRLVRMARGEPIVPGQARDEPKALRAFTQGVMKTARAAKRAQHVIDSPWGRFAFRHHELDANTPSAQSKVGGASKATALVVSRLASEPVRFTEGAAKLDLSSQQREVALMIALGLTNAEIAEKLGVSVNTAGYHVKQVFMKLNVHERGEVARLLRVA
jgi:DNA-binding CsgD family transcriptional regulator